jgi:hypothetical protein
MRPLIQTGLSATTVFLIAGTIGLAIALATSHAEPSADASGRESLRGLVGMGLLIEPLNIEIEQRGLETEKLESDIRQRLQKADIKVLTDRERLATPAAAMLVVRLDALHDRIGRYFYSADLLLTQRVRLERKGVSELSGVTWLKLGAIDIVADDNVKHLEDQVLRKVDQFIREYLTVNPDRRGSDRLKNP